MINVNCINIKFDEITSISDVIKKFSFVHSLKKNTKLKVNIDIPDKVYPEYLTIVVAIIKYFQNRGIDIDINVNNPSNNNYVSRINFYKELGIEHEEDFKRRSSEGRFVEITKFDAGNNVAVTNNIMKVIRNNCKVDSTVVDCLNYCLFEMVDNVENHANSPIGGYTVVQNYSYRNELRLVIVDTGIGIFNSLTKTEGTKYDNLSPEDALLYCIKKEVTNGKGMGNGLYQTKEFIINNGGDMEIYSGKHYLDISNGKINIRTCPYWQGTLIYVRINTNNKVDFSSIFGDSVPETVLNANDYIDDILW